jgi:hypothetical protein
MVEFDTNVRISKIEKSISEVKECIGQLLEVIKPENDLWDNSDIICNWKVSERTLSDWRKKGLISYVQVQGKIWYPKSSREAFMNKYSISAKNDKMENRDGDFMITKNEGRVRS